MGLDLVGYLVVGPVNIDNRLDAAFEAINKVKAAIAKWEEDPDSLNKEDNALLMAFDGVDAQDAQELIPDAEVFMHQFVGFWRVGSRDSTSRENPTNPQQKIVFAGDNTWGDAPEGYGYKLLWLADMFGVLDALEIV